MSGENDVKVTPVALKLPGDEYHAGGLTVAAMGAA